jgi:hypothetical protein
MAGGDAGASASEAATGRDRAGKTVVRRLSVMVGARFVDNRQGPAILGD